MKIILTDLPYELYDVVFSFLSLYQVSFSLPVVCKEFYRVINQEMKWERKLCSLVSPKIIPFYVDIISNEYDLNISNEPNDPLYISLMKFLCVNFFKRPVPRSFTEIEGTSHIHMCSDETEESEKTTQNYIIFKNTEKEKEFLAKKSRSKNDRSGFSEIDECVRSSVPFPLYVNSSSYYSYKKVRPLPLVYVEFQVHSHFLALGLIQENYRFDRMPGWNRFSIGYHGDDGGIFFGEGIHRRKFEGYDEGDVVGIGYHYKTKSIFFSKNGHFAGIGAFIDDTKPKLTTFYRGKESKEEEKENEISKPEEKEEGEGITMISTKGKEEKEKEKDLSTKKENLNEFVKEIKYNLGIGMWKEPASLHYISGAAKGEESFKFFEEIEHYCEQENCSIHQRVDQLIDEWIKNNNAKIPVLPLFRKFRKEKIIKKEATENEEEVVEYIDVDVEEEEEEEEDIQNEEINNFFQIFGFFQQLRRAAAAGLEEENEENDSSSEDEDEDGDEDEDDENDIRFPIGNVNNKNNNPTNEENQEENESDNDENEDEGVPQIRIRSNFSRENSKRRKFN